MVAFAGKEGVVQHRSAATQLLARRRAVLRRIAPSVLATLGMFGLPTCEDCIESLPPEEQKAARAVCALVDGFIAAGGTSLPASPDGRCDDLAVADGPDGRSELEIFPGIGSISAWCSMQPVGGAMASCDADFTIDLAPTATRPQFFQVFLALISSEADVQATVDCGGGPVGPNDGPTTAYAVVGQQADCVVSLRADAAAGAVGRSDAVVRVDFRLARDGDEDGVETGDACPGSPTLPVGPQGCAVYGPLTFGRFFACNVLATCPFGPDAGECEHCRVERVPVLPGELVEACDCMGRDPCRCEANADGSITTQGGVHVLGDLGVDCSGGGAWGTAQNRVLGCYWAPPGGGRTWNAAGLVAGCPDDAPCSVVVPADAQSRVGEGPVVRIIKVTTEGSGDGVFPFAIALDDGEDSEIVARPQIATQSGESIRLTRSQFETLIFDEAQPLGWRLVGVTCDPPGIVEVGQFGYSIAADQSPAVSVTCIFTNERIPPEPTLVDLQQVTDPNEVVPVPAGWAGLPGGEKVAVIGTNGFELYDETGGFQLGTPFLFETWISGLFFDGPSNTDLLFVFRPGFFGGMTTGYDGDIGEFGLQGLRNGATGANYRNGDPYESEGVVVSAGAVYRLFTEGTPPTSHFLNQETLSHQSFFPGVTIQSAYVQTGTSWIAAAATNGNVYVHDSNSSVNATLAASGHDDTRVFECIRDPMDADKAFCAATSTAADKLSLYHWNGSDAMTPLGDVDTGDQPIGLDLSLGGWGQLQIVAANSGDGSATYATVDPATFDVQSETEPLAEGCTSPVSVAKVGGYHAFSCRPQNRLLYFPIEVRF